MLIESVRSARRGASAAAAIRRCQQTVAKDVRAAICRHALMPFMFYQAKMQRRQALSLCFKQRGIRR